jgi:hypothetical protein
MIIEVSRAIKKIRTYKDLCGLLNDACEYRYFNIVKIATITARVNELFNVPNTSELKSDKYQDYAHMFLCTLHDLYSNKSDEFLRRRR